MSFGQPAEMAAKDADAEILAAIDEIEFNFGRERFTTAQAKLLFTYETGLDLDRLYVIALSENCGTVIFYIPDDLAAGVMERAGELHCTAGRYIADLIDFRWEAEPAAELAAVEPDPHNGLWNMAYTTERRHPERKANNWLKMHGFPMRRKGKGRKHHE